MHLDRVMLALYKAPPGYPERLSLSGYEALDDERKRHYEPLYAKYRTKKVRDYDPDYGYFVGWKPVQVGMGEPVGYKYIGYISAKLIDLVMDSSVLTTRILNKSNKW